MRGGRAKGRAGLSKVRRRVEKAICDGFEFLWFDTFCIDKRSSAELSEAINSMHRWYENAEACSAYMADVDSLDDEGSSFRKSRWFTRGWTLQELLALGNVEFLAKDWTSLGTISDLQEMISTATGIDEGIFKAQRISWASARRTARVEDIVCCLMGVFNVNMPLLYGEGDSAFLRLQEAIMKDSDDQSLFAWCKGSHQSVSLKGHGLLANSLTDFAATARELLRLSLSLTRDSRWNYFLSPHLQRAITLQNLQILTKNLSLYLSVKLDLLVYLALGYI